jgi:hypothetical protein
MGWETCSACATVVLVSLWVHNSQIVSLHTTQPLLEMESTKTICPIYFNLFVPKLLKLILERGPGQNLSGQNLSGQNLSADITHRRT